MNHIHPKDAQTWRLVMLAVGGVWLGRVRPRPGPIGPRHSNRHQ